MNSPYEIIKQEMTEAARRCGRDPAEVSLVAVTKQVEWGRILPLYKQGQRDFGESRLAEAFIKQEEAPADSHWHFIGNLQKNKVRKAVGKFALIHSIDSFELAEKLSFASLETGNLTSILLQVNISGEASKHGLNPEGCKNCFKRVLDLRGIAVKGLMTMAPLTEDTNVLRKCFRGLRLLREELNLIDERADLPHLSMGMSHDFKIAIEEGATLVRIGTALFHR